MRPQGKPQILQPLARPSICWKLERNLTDLSDLFTCALPNKMVAFILILPTARGRDWASLVASHHGFTGKIPQDRGHVAAPDTSARRID
jgi:hypothetical protein